MVHAVTLHEPLGSEHPAGTEPSGRVGEGRSACLNCSTALMGPYCAACGQKQVSTDLTVREFLHEVTAELTHLDGKVPSSLKTLFFNPGVLTADYLEGRRARWLRPLRLYLICSIAYFLAGPLTEMLTHRSAREVMKITLTNPDGTTSLTEAGRQQIEETLPGRLFGRERLERAVANSAALNRATDTAFPKAMFVLLPLFALLTNVAWRRKLPRYPAHLYLALHLHAAWFGVLAVMTIATMFLSPGPVMSATGVIVLAYVVWYGLLTVRRVFGDSWPRTIAKSIAAGIVYGTLLLVVGFGLLAYAVYRI